MVLPLQPIGAGLTGQIPGLALRASRPTDITRADSTPGAVQGVPTSGSSPESPPLQDVVAQLFETLGLDTQNNQAIQMLIALLMLLAVLESMEQGTGASGNAAGGFADQQLDPSGFSVYQTTTTFTFEQSTTTITYSDGALADLLGGEAGASPGDQIDVSA